MSVSVRTRRESFSAGYAVLLPPSGVTEGTPLSRKASRVRSAPESRSFDAYLWRFTGGKVIDGRWQKPEETPTVSEVSRRLSADLRKRGMAYVGPVITYSFLQAIGMVNDHLADCPCRDEKL